MSTRNAVLSVPWLSMLRRASSGPESCFLDALEEYRERFVESNEAVVHLTPRDLRAAQTGDIIFDTAQVLHKYLYTTNVRSKCE